MSLNIKRIKQLVVILLTICTTLSACKPSQDKKELRAQILDIHQKLIDAHLKKDPGYFTQNLSENFISVKDGDIFRPTAQEIMVNMENYILNTEFSEYRDLRDPIIGFSEDGTTAWAVVQVKVAGERNLDDGTVRNIDFTCAWLTLYKKKGRGWDVLAEVSTFK